MLRVLIVASIWAAELTPGWTEIIVASIGAVGVTAAAVGGGVVAVNRRAAKVEETLGQREERGEGAKDPSVVEWLRTIETLTRGHQEWMSRQETKLDDLGVKVDASTEQMGRVERRLEDLETRQEHTQGRLEEAIGRIERLEEGRG